MKKLALAVGVLCALTLPARAQVVGGQMVGCTSVFSVSQAATSIARILTGVAGRTINLCGWSANAGAAAATFTITQGTGTNCNANTVVLAPTYSLGINGVLVDHPTFAFYSLPPLTDLCLTSTGTGPLAIMIYYGQ